MFHAKSDKPIGDTELVDRRVQVYDNFLEALRAFVFYGVEYLSVEIFFAFKIALK